MSEAKAGNTAKGWITVSVECLDRMTDAAIEADKKVRAFADAVGCGQPPQEWYDEDMDGLWDDASRALDALKKRKCEDVDEWARRIADDVCEATDW